MKPIRIALFHRDDWYRGSARIDGLFSYPVPEFEWTHMPVTKGFQSDLHALRGKAEVVFWDDGKYKDYAGFSPDVGQRGYCPPVVMYALYPTLTPGHLTRRVNRAKTADAVFVDHDDLGIWANRTGLPVRRCAYATNEYLYSPRGQERDIDVFFPYVTGWSKERPALDLWLAENCAKRGLRYASTHGENIGVEYARMLGRSRVVVHMNRTPRTRPPRIFDAACAGACVVSNEMPRVSGEDWAVKRSGEYYLAFNQPYSSAYEEFEKSAIPDYKGFAFEQLDYAISVAIGSEGARIAEAARSCVMACHTWRVRAREMYATLLDLFPILRPGRENYWFEGG